MAGGGTEIRPLKTLRALGEDFPSRDEVRVWWSKGLSSSSSSALLGGLVYGVALGAGVWVLTGPAARTRPGREGIGSST